MHACMYVTCCDGGGRYELRAAAGVLGAGELEGCRGRAGVHRVARDGVDAAAGGEPQRRPLPLPSAGLDRHLLRRPLPSVSRDIKVSLLCMGNSVAITENVGFMSVASIRLGFIIDFLSKATLVGFMAGSAIIVSLQQLRNLLGIVHFTKKMGVVPVMSSVFHNTNEVHLLLPLRSPSFSSSSLHVALFGCSGHGKRRRWGSASWPSCYWRGTRYDLSRSYCPACFLSTRTCTTSSGMRRPKLSWISVGAPLASVVVSTLVVFLLKAQNHGISTVSPIQIPYREAEMWPESSIMGQIIVRRYPLEHHHENWARYRDHLPRREFF
ncbi:hypothetical protein B296_00057419 [Ensete ventricosum]|uniref:SLC26A/SulP transporter domain-containing protein n=1 Tax=Ensete ventricosum TaxID=4639 RepID=A0A426XBR9_ENSVE|nr:hypothetical protein B296_00057419 [Ensete ventricosum]